MAASTAAVLSGLVNAYLHPTAQTNPVTETSGGSVSWSGWTELDAFTREGIEFSYAPDVRFITVDQRNSAIKASLVGEELRIKMMMAESSLVRQQYAFGSGTYVAGATDGAPRSIKFGDGTLTEYAFGAQGPGPTAANDFVLYVPRVVIVNAVEYPFKKDDDRIIQIEFAALTDESASAGARLGALYELLS